MHTGSLVAVLDSLTSLLYACILPCRLQSQVLDLDGVGHALLGPFKEGGLRGGSVTMQIEVERRLPLSMLIQSIQALDEALLILPFKTNSWLWRYGQLSCYYALGS